MPYFSLVLLLLSNHFSNSLNSMCLCAILVVLLIQLMIIEVDKSYGAFLILTGDTKCNTGSYYSLCITTYVCKRLDYLI